MPKSTKVQSNFMTAGPLSTGATIAVVISLLLNLGALLAFVLVHHTANYDSDLYNYTHKKICVTDYATLSTADQTFYTNFCK